MQTQFHTPVFTSSLALDLVSFSFEPQDPYEQHILYFERSHFRELTF